MLMLEEDAEGLALLKDGDLGEFDHPHDTLALMDPVECAADRDEDDDGTRALSRPAISRKRRFWHRRARGMSSYHFFTLFRCRKSTFVKLVKGLYGTTDELEGEGGRMFDPCEHVAIFLYRVATSQEVVGIAGMLDVPDDWVTTITMQVARLVAEKLKRRYVPWPDAERQAVLASEWEAETDMRNIIGEIGATHITGRMPPCNVRKQHTNFNGFFTTILLGIVDIRGSFLWFESGVPGALRDDGALKKTSLYRRIQTEQRKAKTNASNEGKGKDKGKDKTQSSSKGKGKGKGKGKAPPPPPPAENTVLALDGACVLGDSAFVERPWLRTPIPDPRTRKEHYFNHRHGSLREADGNACDGFPGGARSFGRLKWLFRCLDGMLFSLDRSPIIIDACVVLYNFFLAHDGDTEKDDDGTFKFADRTPTKKFGYGGRAQWERDCESDPPSARKVEMDYLSDNCFLRRDWGKKGSSGARMV